MQALYDLKDMLLKELDEYAEKGDLSAGRLDIIDKLAHAVKSIETIIAMNEYDEDKDRYSRGRGRKRDSMGRYASRGTYNNGSYDDGMMDELRDIMENVTDERKRHEFQKFINKVQQM